MKGHSVSVSSQCFTLPSLHSFSSDGPDMTWPGLSTSPPSSACQPSDASGRSSLVLGYHKITFCWRKRSERLESHEQCKWRMRRRSREVTRCDLTTPDNYKLSTSVLSQDQAPSLSGGLLRSDEPVKATRLQTGSWRSRVQSEPSLG